MAPPASEQPRSAFEGLIALLAPFDGRLEFAVRLGLICALTVLLVEIYQTPEPALTAYVAFFVIKPDRTASVVVSIVLLLLITVIVSTVIVITMQVIDQPFWRVVAMTVVSFGLLFMASASKLKPIAGTVALITAYALDLLGVAHGGEIATRALLYAWLFVGMPAGVSIVVNLVLGPPPRRLAERALAHRLQLCARMLGAPTRGVCQAFATCLREGLGEIPEWLKLAGIEKTSPPEDIAALKQAAQSTAVILSVVEVLVRDRLLSEALRGRIARTLEDMAAILRKGGYPVDITFEDAEDAAMLSSIAVAVLAELKTALIGFAEPPPPEPSPQPVAKAAPGFFLPDAFTNTAHMHYALKTTAAAMFCYVTYSLLNWPGIHTCLITCYIVSLGTTAETIEKLTLRILGCLLGAGAGIAAIVFLMPNITSIGALMALVFVATLVAGWIAAGTPRISYIGFQIAFAFFLCVVQGSAPAFDMTVARDRVIGIIFGNLVVALVFTLIWPVSVAGRIDPALARLLRQLAAMAGAGSRPKRWALAAETRRALGAIEQDLDLTHYEPIAIRPVQHWLGRRHEIARALALLQGPLLIDGDQRLTASGIVAPRLAWLAEHFESHKEPAATFAGSFADGPAVPGMMSALIDGPLGKLEHAIVQPSVSDPQGKANDART